MIRSVVCMVLALLLACSGAAQAQCPALNSLGLIGHWKLDETGATTTAVDSSPNGYNGTMINGLSGTKTTAGKVDTALIFDIGDDYIDMGQVLQGLSTMSVSAWIYPANDSSQMVIADHSDTQGGGGEGWVFYLRYAADGDIGFSVLTDTNDARHVSTGGAITPNAWNHVVVTWDGSMTASNIHIYVNGTEVSYGASQNGSGGHSDGSTSLTIGAPSSDMDGNIDDVRIYNRALSADEIAALYAVRSTADAPAGYMTYDTRSAAMIYCNGTDWVHAGIGSYNPNAVRFDGVNDRLNSDALTGASDSKRWTGSFWFRTDSNANMEIFDTDQTAGGGDLSFILNQSVTDRIEVQASNSADTSILYLRTDSFSGLDDGQWHHVMWSVDMNDSAKRHLYLDGVAGTLSAITWTNDLIDFDTNATNWLIIGRNNLGADYIGDLADFWMDAGTYIDFSDEANRRKFTSASGMPIYLGPDGSIPTGAQPDIFLSGDTVNWHTNKGSGGGFTENGALTTASSQPGDSVLATTGLDVGLIGHWPLNEVSGTTTYDASGNSNDGTLVGDTAWVAGQVGGAATFDSNGDYISIANESFFDFERTDPFSISAWFKRASNTTEDDIVEKWNSEGYDIYFFGGDDYLRFSLDGNNSQAAVRTTSTLNTGTWYHVVATYDGSSSTSGMKLYVDGVSQSLSVVRNDLSETIQNNVKLAIGAENGDFPAASTSFDGEIDDVRVYDRELTAEEVADLYATNGCEAGKIVYNAGFSVMQYCNGAEWVAMGPVGGTPPTNGLIGHWKLDESGGTTAADGTGNHDGTLTNMDPGTDWVSGQVGNALEFDGSDDVVTMANSTTNMPTDTITIAAWVYPVGDMDPFGNGGRVISKSDGGASENWGIVVSDSAGWEFQCRINGVEVIYTGTALPTDTWSHVACSYDKDASSNNVILYLNGASVKTGTETTAMATSGTVSLGKHADAAGRAFSGRIDDARIYNRALSDTEISQLYHYGLSGGLGDVSGNCASPSKPEGSMFYNLDYNVTQYCNGEEWIGIGK